MMEKEPKRYECTACGFISNRTKALRLPGISFCICFKCRGRLKERTEWLEWLNEQRKRQFQEAKDKNEGYILGVKVAEV